MENTSPLDLSEDHHVHSTFSDGLGSLEENLAAAGRAGLGYLGFVDHVRAGSDWLPEFSQRVSELSKTAALEVTCGVEAKILDLDGTLDIPRELPGIARIVVADHQMPTSTGPIRPTDVRRALTDGTLSAHRVVHDLVTATRAAMERRHGLLLAHLFSILPKLGLAEDDVSDDQLARLVDAAQRSRALVEVSERWRCPSLRVARAFFDAGVSIVASSDAHAPEAIGRFDYVASVSEDLGMRVEPRGAA